MINDSAPAVASQLLNSVVYEVSEDVVLDTTAKIEKALAGSWLLIFGKQGFHTKICL